MTGVAFVCGLILGVPGGVFVVALCMAGRRADDESERYAEEIATGRRWRQLNPPEEVSDAEWYDYAERNGHL